MLTAETLPPHDPFFRLDHIIHEPGSAAARAVLEIDRDWWLNTDQMAKAVDSGSIWTVNWMSEWPAAGHAHAAADFDAIAAVITGPAKKPLLADLVDKLRLAVSQNRDIDCTRRAEALRMIGRIAGIVADEPARIIVPG